MHEQETVHGLHSVQDENPACRGKAVSFCVDCFNDYLATLTQESMDFAAYYFRYPDGSPLLSESSEVVTLMEVRERMRNQSTE